MHDARSVANELIKRAKDEQRSVTPLQIAKLTYFCHAWMLGLYHEPLLKQPVEAWRYGPVVPEVYRSLRRYGGEPITRLIEIESEDYDSRETDLIDQVWEKYGGFTGTQLSSMTHGGGTPWDEVWNRWGQSSVIPDPIIEKYYSNEAAKVRESV